MSVLFSPPHFAGRFWKKKKSSKQKKENPKTNLQALPFCAFTEELTVVFIIFLGTSS